MALLSVAAELVEFAHEDASAPSSRLRSKPDHAAPESESDATPRAGGAAARAGQTGPGNGTTTPSRASSKDNEAFRASVRLGTLRKPLMLWHGLRCVPSDSDSLSGWGLHCSSLVLDYRYIIRSITLLGTR